MAKFKNVSGSGLFVKQLGYVVSAGDVVEVADPSGFGDPVWEPEDAAAKKAKFGEPVDVQVVPPAPVPIP